MKQDRNIILIGFMGTGKTTVGQSLAKLLNRPYVSTDDLIVEQEGLPIVDIFSKKGEVYFREVETQVITEVSRRKHAVIDCGGGVVLNPQNIELLKINGTVFHLFATPEFILEQAKGRTDRPLLNVPNPLEEIKRLLELRKPFYQGADFHVSSDHRAIKDICQEIIGKLSHD
ncbi:MAG: shikimate kinase [Candidatus Omnitrophica bacterium]|nr:shikimate kinase [Candidatus Omnitrophota bacterium]